MQRPLISIFDMKCLKVEEYIKRTASLKETELFLQELKNDVRNGLGIQGRTLCDRVIRACNHQLGVGSLDSDHVSHLVKLVELSLHGYDVSAALVHQTTPLYMEKIIFHIIKKLSSLEAHSLCTHVAEMLYNRLKLAQQAEDYCILLRSCFSVLWSGITKDRKILNPRDKLHCQMQALSFLLLLKPETAFFSKAVLCTEDALTEYESSCRMVTREDASFLVQEVHTLLNRYWTAGRGCEGDGKKQYIEISTLYVLFEMVLMGVKVLCVAGQYDLASTPLNEIESKMQDCGEFQCTALLLGKWAVNLHAAMRSGEENAELLTQCARVLRSLPVDLGEQEAHAVLEGCGLVAWVVSGHKKELGGPVLLAWFAFIEEHQKQIINMLNKAESNRLQQALCFSMYQGFVLAYESMLSSQLDNSNTLDRVLLYCHATAGQMMNELHKLPSENLLNKAVIAVTNLACGLYNQRLYDQAFILIEILCRDLLKNCPTSLSIDRLSRPFMLAVQTSRRAGQLERALDWVILWLRALRDDITTCMSEPVSQWVKIKIDAARNSEEDIRLRTLRDGFSPDVPDEGVMLCLLDEELRAYKEVAGDTAQERYNTLCDLLDICHEESPHTHLRVVYLCEMAQVVCFQDFSEQTDCAAVDFTHEALRLLEEVPETSENFDRLHDAKAHSFLWLYICTLEKNLQKAIEKDHKLREVREQTRILTNPIGTNDFDYENEQKTQDSVQVYAGLHFNLAAEKKLCNPLERALDEWSTLLKSEVLPSVRNPRQTCSSIGLTAALFKLMGKPVKALEAYQLAIRLSRHLADTHGCANFLCQSASILLDIGSPELALVQLEQAEKLISSDTSAEGPSPLSMLAVLLKAQYCYSTGQVDCGVPYLCSVLKEVNEQKQSKSWYLLRARTLQTCCSYLSLDTAALPQMQRSCITQFGINSPDTAIYESLKLLCSLLVTLVGKGLYGSIGSSSDVCFIDQGDNLVLKWQLLSELLNCSVKMVTVRSNCGVINDARLQCLEALKLATKLQTLGQCAELLVIKAELELMQGEREECGFDLEKVRCLLDLCTDFSDQVQRAEVKIKPRKGRPAQKTQCPIPALEDDLKGILSTRWIVNEAIVEDLASSPPPKAQPHRWLSSLAHEKDCQCPCCSEPCLGRATARWAAAQADLHLQLNPNESKVSLKLQCATLARCKSVTAKLGAKLQKLFLAKGSCKPSLMQDVMGRVYLHMSMSGLEPRLNKISDIWKTMEAGLSFVDSTPSPVLRDIGAGLKATKAMISLMTLSSKKGCLPEELFSNAWTWNAPNDRELKSEERKVRHKKPKESIKNPDVCDKTKVKVVKAKIQLETSTKGKGPFPMTPVMLKSKSTVQELGCFDFNTVVPTLSFTPIQKANTSVRKAPRTASKQPFHVYEEFPNQDKVQPVPAAPRRTKKSRFKMEFSDESDSEVKTKPELEDKTDVPKKRTTARRAAANDKKAPDLPAEKVQPKRQSRVKKQNQVSQGASSEDDVIKVCQPASTKRGRSRRLLSRAGAETVEEPDNLRSIEEDTTEVMDISIEELRTSDVETEDNPASNFDFEVLRRDMCCNFERDDLPEVRNKHHLRDCQQTHLPFSNTKPDNISLEDVQSLLRSAWLSLQHFPSPTIYPTICSLLALTIGQQDPVTTAMLHTQSLGITSRHRTIRHLASCFRKLRKTHSDLAEKMDAITLNESNSTELKTSAEQRLCQLEKIFSFPTADSLSFPANHCQEFTEQLQHLPPGITVCVMSVVGIKPGEIGNGIVLSRLEKGLAPVTVHIPTSKKQLPISWLVQEMDNIQVEQKVVSFVSEKAKWWEGRRALDSRVERLLKEMEGLLGCWKSFLLPLSSDPGISKQTQQLCEALSGRGMTVSKEMLQAMLSASPVLSQEDLHSFARGLSPQWDVECEQLLCQAVSQLEDRTEPLGHVVLILDKYLQKLPWESMSILKSCSVSRMPSLQSLIGLSIQKEVDSQSILKRGVNAKQVFYVLDPDANLGNSRDQFKEWFSSKLDWEGVCGVAPDSSRLEEAVATKDLYIYVGHGAGARFLDSQAVLKRQMRTASMLFGCSSAALAVRGDQEGQGIILNYLIAGCPFVLGNLWDVTDRDIDRFTKALLESWLGAGSGAPLLDHMGSSRQATHLKHLIGAAPVVYGLPVHLQ